MRLKTVYFSLLLSLCIGISGCSQANKTNQINQKSIVYGSYHNGEQDITVADAVTLKTVKTIKVTEGWTDRIYLDQKNRIWVPIVYKPDMNTAENKIYILNNDGSMDHVEVGASPHYVFFQGDAAYVLCDEEGFNPTLYKINSQNQAKKVMTIKDGGLISNAVSDGGNIYFSSYQDDGNHQFYPTLVKVALDGKAEIKRVSNEKLGLNNLLLMDHQLIFGLEAPKGQSTLVMYDAATLKKIKNLNFTEPVVGDIVPVDNGNIAVTNYSKTASIGQKITVLNVKSNKIIKTFNTHYPIEGLSYIKGQFIAVNNYSNKLEILAKNGNTKKIVKAPLQVTNLLLRSVK